MDGELFAAIRRGKLKPALMPWTKENLGPLFASPTEAVDGTVIVSA